MGPGLLSAALFVGSALLFADHSRSERSRRGPSWDPAGGPGWLAAMRGRLGQKGRQAQAKERLDAKGSIFGRSPLAFFPLVGLGRGSVLFCCSDCLENL